MKQHLYKVLMLLAGVLVTLCVNAQTITKFAGDTTLTTGGDGGPATAAGLNQPWSLVRDASGNIYIGEGNGNRIRIVLPTGLIGTFAGTGVTGFSGDGGLATAAQVAGPGGLALDAAGDMVFADFGNNRIRKINHTTFMITTIAGTGTASYTGDGGAATAATFNHPRDISFDGSGNMYICDWSNHVIRKINTSGNISTFAGNGSTGASGDGGPATAAAIDLPYETAFDASGNMYIVSSSNNNIRKINMSSGIISTVVGSPTAASGFSGDGGPATASLLSLPTALTFDGIGNMYIADRGNGRIRKVDLAGVIHTVVGTGASFESGDGGPAIAATINRPFAILFDPSNNMYIANINGNVVRKVSPDPALGVHQYATASNEIVLAPNPSNGMFHISGSLISATDEIIAFEIINVLGQVVYSSATAAKDGFINATINTGNDLGNGHYLLQMHSARENIITRFLISK